MRRSARRDRPLGWSWSERRTSRRCSTRFRAAGMSPGDASLRCKLRGLAGSVFHPSSSASTTRPIAPTPSKWLSPAARNRARSSRPTKPGCAPRCGRKRFTSGSSRRSRLPRVFRKMCACVSRVRRYSIPLRRPDSGCRTCRAAWPHACRASTTVSSRRKPCNAPISRSLPAAMRWHRRAPLSTCAKASCLHPKRARSAVARPSSSCCPCRSAGVRVTSGGRSDHIPSRRRCSRTRSPLAKPPSSPSS